MDRAKIEDTLLEIGVSVHLQGFKYIIDSVILLDSEEWCGVKMLAVYEKVGKINRVTWPKVERSIRYALKAARDSGDHEKVEHYIGFDNPQNASSLARLHMMLSREDRARDSM